MAQDVPRYFDVMRVTKMRPTDQGIDQIGLLAKPYVNNAWAEATKVIAHKNNCAIRQDDVIAITADISGSNLSDGRIGWFITGNYRRLAPGEVAALRSGQQPTRPSVGGPVRVAEAPQMPPAVAQPTAPYGNLAPRMSSGGEEPVTNIVDLNPYVNRFIIKARLTQKSSISKFSNQKGEGQRMKLRFTDNTGDISATVFGEPCDRLTADLREGGVYRIGKVRCKQQNPKFKSGSHPCELMVDERSEFVPESDTADIPKDLFKFVPIAEIAAKSKDAVLDVMGLVVDAGPINSITIKRTGQQKDKRDVTILDSSMASIQVTLWEEACQIVPESAITTMNVSPVMLVIKDAKVDEYNGQRLGASFNSQLYHVTPEYATNYPGSAELAQWYVSTYLPQNKAREIRALSASSAGGTSAPFQTLGDAKNYCSGSDAAEALAGNGYWFVVNATIELIDKGRSFFWDACEKCNRKVTAPEAEQYSVVNEGDSTRHCPHCNEQVRIRKKWVCRTKLRDATGVIQAMAMGDKAMSIMDSDCDEVFKLSLNVNEEDSYGRNFESIFQRPCGQLYCFKMCCSNSSFSPGQIDYKIIDAKALDGSLTAYRTEEQRIISRVQEGGII